MRTCILSVARRADRPALCLGRCQLFVAVSPRPSSRKLLSVDFVKLMENSCQQLAEPLALAVSECLRKQEVDVNEVVLTSYLLEVSPDPEILNRLELENQIDSLGNVGNVSITLARMEDDGCVAREEGVEQLVVIGGKDKKKRGFLVNNVQEDEFSCLDSLRQGAQVSISKKAEDLMVYSVQAEWRAREQFLNINEEESIVVVEEDPLNGDEVSFEVVERAEKIPEEEMSCGPMSRPDDVTDDAITYSQRRNRETDVEANQNITTTPETPTSEDSFTATAVTQRKEEVLEAIAEELRQRRERRVGSCHVRESVRGNNRKKLLVIGKTGTGKSSLCNVLTGNLPNAKAFPVSGKATTCTQETTFADADFCGVPSKPISIVDTIGFDDPTKDHDAKIIADLVLQLQQNCDYVNTFVMAVNGQNPRLDGSLLQMIKIFEKMFTSKFWDQVVVVFTRLHMDKPSIERRLEENEGSTDDILAKEYLSEIERLFGVETSRLNYLFLDSQYRRTDVEEVQAFFNHSERLYNHLMEMPGLPTSEITTVLTENQRLWAKINKLQVAMGGAAVGGVAALGVATAKSVVADAAVKEAARALAEKAAAETAASVAQAELARLTQELTPLQKQLIPA